MFPGGGVFVQVFCLGVGGVFLQNLPAHIEDSETALHSKLEK